MIKFFRKIREQLLSENKFSKYIIYAIGEIALVVIGILIALYINNSNQKSIEEKTLNNYYAKIHHELILMKDQVNFLKTAIDTVAINNKRSLYLLSLKNKDSLHLLKESLGDLGTAYTNDLKYPVVKEFLNEGFLTKVRNEKIKTNLQIFSWFLKQSSSFDKYVTEQYFGSIEPYFIKHINYAEVSSFGNKLNSISEGPKTNYQQFYNNLELWNIITFKLETVTTQQELLQGFINFSENLTKVLDQELNIKSNDKNI